MATVTETFLVSGIRCERCVLRLANALEDQPGRAVRARPRTHSKSALSAKMRDHNWQCASAEPPAPCVTTTTGRRA